MRSLDLKIGRGNKIEMREGESESWRNNKKERERVKIEANQDQGLAQIVLTENLSTWLLILEQSKRVQSSRQLKILRYKILRYLI